jgi:poly-gamma-glutamate synthesis protein (capsule biosynthesis protein)
VLVAAFLLVVGLTAGVILGRAHPLRADLSAYPWLFLRESRPIAPEEALAEVIFVGDVMLGRGLADGSNPFTAVAPWLRTADLTVGNLECVVTTNLPGGDAVSGGDDLVPLVAAPGAVDGLRRAGFDLLGLANNHAADLGREGVDETVSRLSAAGLTAFGIRTEGEAEIRPVLRDVQGVRLAFLGFNAIPGVGGLEAVGGWIVTWDPEGARAAVRRAEDEADGVVVFIHWGYEYESRVDHLQERAADLLLEAGADLVVGHHPHVVQSFEIDRGRCVAYSLGNFVFDQGWDGTGQGLALRAFFDTDGLRGVQGLPVRAGARPSLLPPDDASSILPSGPDGKGRMTFSCTETTCSATTRLESDRRDLPSGVFWGGRIDLTGDGTVEHVRRVDDRVTIYSAGEEVWRSPDAWRVVDLALGDPNDDGRDELVLALWKPGLDGLEPPAEWKARTPRSRPFIVGYRGGLYRTVWGGSAVSEPIHEVELGDVDGDGAEELLVLEAPEAGSRQRRIAVWRWHGWGFSLVWRSEADRFSNLIVDEAGRMHVHVE